jgi:hypothetical protein
MSSELLFLFCNRAFTGAGDYGIVVGRSANEGRRWDVGRDADPAACRDA